jgi:hypothetical protein
MLNHWHLFSIRGSSLFSNVKNIYFCLIYDLQTYEKNEKRCIESSKTIIPLIVVFRSTQILPRPILSTTCITSILKYDSKR